MMVAFELDGQAFTALNGGPVFTFNEAVSFQVACETQAEVDFHWDKLVCGRRPTGTAVRLAKGPIRPVVAGFPRVLPALVGDPGSEKSQRALKAMLQMKKIDLEKIQQVYDGTA